MHLENFVSRVLDEVLELLDGEYCMAAPENSYPTQKMLEATLEYLKKIALEYVRLTNNQISLMRLSG